MIVLMLMLAQVPAPCGNTPQHPCYTKTLPYVADAGFWMSIESGWPEMTASPCVCRCVRPSLVQVYEPALCSHEHGFETAAWLFGAFTSIAALISAAVVVASRLDKIVAAWRRAEIPKRWWWKPLGWFAFTVATILGQLLGLWVMGR